MYESMVAGLLLIAGAVVVLTFRVFLMPPQTTGYHEFSLARMTFAAHWRTRHILFEPRHREIARRVEEAVRLRFLAFTGPPDEAKEVLQKLCAGPQVNAIGREFSVVDLWVELL